MGSTEKQIVFPGESKNSLNQNNCVDEKILSIKFLGPVNGEEERAQKNKSEKYIIPILRFLIHNRWRSQIETLRRNSLSSRNTI